MNKNIYALNPKKKHISLNRSNKDIAAKVIIYLILVVFLLVSVMPLVFMVITALKSSTELNQNPFALPKKITLQHLKEAWAVGRMGKYFFNSIIVALPRVVGVLTLSTLAGYAFGKLKFPGRNILFYFFLFGMMIPIQAMLIPLYYNMQRLNLINSYWAMILPALGLSMPFSIFMMRAFFRDLPDELMESAKIDGCNNFTALIHIMMPLTFPALSSLFVFEFMWSWNDFLLPLLVVYDDAYRTLPLGLMFFQGEYTSNRSLIAAAVTIACVPIIAIYVVFQRKFIEGITAGAVKG